MLGRVHASWIAAFGVVLMASCGTGADELVSSSFSDSSQSLLVPTELPVPTPSSHGKEEGSSHLISAEAQLAAAFDLPEEVVREQLQFEEDFSRIVYDDLLPTGQVVWSQINAGFGRSGIVWFVDSVPQTAIDAFNGMAVELVGNSPLSLDELKALDSEVRVSLREKRLAFRTVSARPDSIQIIVPTDRDAERILLELGQTLTLPNGGSIDVSPITSDEFVLLDSQ